MAVAIDGDTGADNDERGRHGRQRAIDDVDGGHCEGDGVRATGQRIAFLNGRAQAAFAAAATAIIAHAVARIVVTNIRGADIDHEARRQRRARRQHRPRKQRQGRNKGGCDATKNCHARREHAVAGHCVSPGSWDRDESLRRQAQL